MQIGMNNQIAFGSKSNQLKKAGCQIADGILKKAQKANLPKERVEIIKKQQAIVKFFKKLGIIK